MTARQRLRWINWFFVLTYAAALVNTGAYLREVHFSDSWTNATALAIYLTYTAAYLVPAALLTRLVDRIFRTPFFCRRNQAIVPTATRNWLVIGTALAMTSLTQIGIYADKSVFKLFGMHMNGFVWNTIFAKGGIEATGSSTATIVSYVLYLASFPVLQSVLIVVSRRLASPAPSHRATRVTGRLVLGSVGFFAAAALGQALAFGISDIRSYSPILAMASAFPLYEPVTFRGLARRMGFEVESRPGLDLPAPSMRLNYPVAPLDLVPPPKPLNLVWLVAESLRADMLDPQIMPKTWAFAEEAHRFTHHYSGGNGTRMAMFTMFYGLYGSYWFPFLAEGRSPVLMDVLQKQNYQLGLFTSARFTYPEFDRTLFAKVPADKLVEDFAGPGWSRDRRNVERMLAFLQSRDRGLPFMLFEFFESPHAPYHFPDECAIRKPYLEDFNYATADMIDDMPQIKNRYVNSCFHLDTQIERVLAALRDDDLLDSTIVIITGDHGEEFMEKGRWGHNSEFSEEQLRVPMVLWIPGSEASVVDHMTSHLDIPATLLPLVGVRNPAEEASQGTNMLSGPARDYVVVADWSRLGYVDAEYKGTFALEVAATFRNRVTDGNDKPLENPKDFYDARQSRLMELIREMRRFGR